MRVGPSMPSWSEKVPLGRGRVRTLAGCRRSRPVHKESFVCVVGGLRPPTTHTKLFSPERNQINKFLPLAVE